MIIDELRKLMYGFEVNKISLNVSKTNYMLFGNTRNMVSCSIYINNIEIGRFFCS